MVFYIEKGRIEAVLNKLIPFLLIVAVVLFIYYQISYLFAGTGVYFIEPDAYQYYLFANLSIQHHTLNVSNPYLAYPVSGFFEHSGLYQMPVFLYYAIPSIPLIWDFRIIYIMFIICIYAFTLLIARKILIHTPIHRYYRYFIYAMIFSSVLLMQYNEMIEWRGTTFIVAIQLIMLWIASYFYTDNRLWKYIPFMGLALITLALLSIWIWSAGFINLIMGIVLILGAILYRYVFKPHQGIWRYIAILTVFFGFALLLFNGFIDAIILQILAPTGYTFCSNNILALGEVMCLNNNNGLMVVVMDLIFMALAITMLFGKGVFTNDIAKYEYYLFSIFILLIVQLPLALVYLRLISLIAPYLSIMFGLGLVSLFTYFSRQGTSVIVRSLVIAGILVGSFGGSYLFFQSSLYLYSQSSPLGLQQMGTYLSSNVPANSTIFAYYGYGDYIETVGHQKVYADTIQLENSSRITLFDSYMNETTYLFCNKLKGINPSVDYVMLSTYQKNITLFVNDSNNSVALNPANLSSSCLAPVYNASGFYLYKFSP